MYNQTCLICRQKNNSAKQNKLTQLYKILSAQLEPETSYLVFNWNINSRCKYGLACQTLMSNDNYCKRIAHQINPYLTALAHSQNDALYHQVLRLLQGDYPLVYKQVEREFAKSKKEVS